MAAYQAKYQSSRPGHGPLALLPHPLDVAQGLLQLSQRTGWQGWLHLILFNAKKIPFYLDLEVVPEICAGAEAKICEKMCKDMRNPKNMVGPGTQYVASHAFLLQKYDDFFYQEEVLINLGALLGTF